MHSPEPVPCVKRFSKKGDCVVSLVTQPLTIVITLRLLWQWRPNCLKKKIWPHSAVSILNTTSARKHFPHFIRCAGRGVLIRCFMRSNVKRRFMAPTLFIFYVSQSCSHLNYSALDINGRWGKIMQDKLAKQ